MPKFAIGLAIICLAAGTASAQTTQGTNTYGGYGTQGQHQVQGYTNQNGSYVQPHMQTNPNNTTIDNWSTRGNTNPYTGQPGRVAPRN